MTTHTALCTDDTVSVASGHYLQSKKRPKHIGYYIAMYQYAIKLVAERAPNASNTLLKLLATVEHENQLYFHSGNAATRFNMSRSSILDHFEELKVAGAIIPDPKEAGRKRGIVLWRICPWLAWRGKPELMREYVNALPEGHPFLDYQTPEGE